jgi:hypothetical protein
MNVKNYKPKLRGAQYTNKILAKRSNNLKYQQRWQNKMRIEQMQARDQVNAYGGLGKVGLDYQTGEVDDGKPRNYEVPAFSPALAHLNPQPKLNTNLADDESIVHSDSENEENIDEEQVEAAMENCEDLDKQLQLPEHLQELEDPTDMPLFKVPTGDEASRNQYYL